MSVETYLVYLGVLAAFFATPPDTSQLLIISNSLRHGLGRSLATVAGDLSANTLQMTAAAFGLTAVIAASADALWLVKWLGVGYLAWIGLRLMLAPAGERSVETAARGRPAALFHQGFLDIVGEPICRRFLRRPFSAVHRPGSACLAAASDPRRDLPAGGRHDPLALGMGGDPDTRPHPWLRRRADQPALRHADDRGGGTAGLEGPLGGGAAMTAVVLLDGGMGQELIRRSSQPAHPQWSAHVMMHEPELVQAVHEDYLRAGARVLTLNTYATTPGRFARFGTGEQFEPLQLKAVELAKRARDAVGASGDGAAIAGCLPPLVGSYHPELLPGFDALLAEYRQIAAVEAPHVDLFLCETMSKAEEARAAATAATETGRPVWVSWTLAEKLAPDGTARLRSGETLARRSRRWTA